MALFQRFEGLLYPSSTILRSVFATLEDFQTLHNSDTDMAQPPMYPGVPRGGPPQTQECVSRVELRIECRNLLNKDVMSKSDPCAALYMSRRGGHWDEVGRTENIKNCLDPKFSRCFKLNYYFEEVQKIKIAVYDLDNMTPQLDDDDFLGQLDCTLGQLVSNTPYTKPLLLRDGRKAGMGVITVRAEEVKEGGEIAYMTFRGKGLDKKDFLGKSDPYLEILRSTTDRSWQVIHRTEVIKNTLNPSWRPFQVPLNTLCGGNKSQEIRFDVYDWDNDGGHDYIGGYTTNIEEMMKATRQEVMKEHTFLEFIFGGMQVNFTVGIDFTASNGNPANPTSLHYANPYQPNEYMQAIRAVGNVCQDYDSDKLFPALGFGAKIPPQMHLSHEFAVNFNMQNPFCNGIDGVLQAYMNCIQQVQLYGPTNVSPIINHVARFALQAQREEPTQGAHAYHILLLLTDGVLSDMGNTKQAIVEASKLPMSLIIVGVGGADFSMMEELDGDDGVLRAPSGEPVKRDIVQFVPFREFKQSSSMELARHVLAEVPQQVTGYYKMRGIRPHPPQQAPPPKQAPASQQPPPTGRPPQAGQANPQQGQAYPQPGQAYPQAGQAYPQQGQAYPQPGQAYPQPGQGQYSQPGQAYSQQAQAYQQQGQAYQQPGQAYPQPGHGQAYPKPGQAYPQPGQGQYPQAGQAYPQQGQTYPQPGQTYPQPGQGQYPQPGQAYPQPGQAQYPQSRQPGKVTTL